MTDGRPSTLLTRLPSFLAVLAAAAFTALSLNFNAATRFYAWPWFFYWQVLLTVPPVILTWSLLAGRAPLRRFGGWLDAGLVLLAAASVASALFSSFRPQGLNAALTPVAAVCLAYLLLNWIEPGTPERGRPALFLGRLVGVLMLLFVLTSLAMWLGYEVLPARAAGRPAAEAWAIRNENPLGHSVYTAGFAVLAAPWLAGLGLMTRRWERALWLGVAALAAALVPTTSSRGGVIGLIVALACAAWLWLGRSPAPRRRYAPILLGLLLAAGLLVGFNPRLRDFVRQGRWDELTSESNRQRVAMLHAGWLMGRDRPWTGYGLGAVPLVYPRYRALLSGGVEDVLQVHNTPLEFWAELGAPGVLAVLLLIAGVIRLARGPPAEPDDPARPGRLIAATAITTLAGYAAMALTDYQLDVPLFAAVIASLLALLRAGHPDGPIVSPRMRRPLGGLLLAALVLMLWPTLPNLRARWLFAGAADAREAGRPEVFVRQAEQAAVAAPWEAFYPVQLGAFFGEQFLQAEDPAARARARDLGAAELRRALAINPDQDYCHFNLGWLLWLPEPAAADRHFRAAAHLTPDRGGVYLGLGLSLLARNEKKAAAEAFALEWLNDPQTMASPFWTTPPLAALRRDIAAAAQRDNARWREQPDLSAGVRRQLRYVAALTDWWLANPGDMSALIRDGLPEQRRFFAHLPAIKPRAYAPAGGALEPWEELYVAWRDGTPPPNLDDPAFAVALGRRLAREHASFARLLTAPLTDEDGLVQITRRQRPGYSVLMRNQDGFLLNDLYISPDNRLVLRYASFLFPPKGYLPVQLLLARLNDPALAPR
jgi:O-antigen ligase